MQNKYHPIVKGLAFLISLPLAGTGLWFFLRGILVSWGNPIYDTIFMPITFLWNADVALALCLGYGPAIVMIVIARALMHVSGIWPMEEKESTKEL